MLATTQNHVRSPFDPACLWQMQRCGYLLFTADLLCLTAAWYLAGFLRLVLNSVMVRQMAYADLNHVAPPLAAILIVWSSLAFWYRLYDSRVSASATRHLVAIAEGVILAAALVIVEAFLLFDGPVTISRAFVLLFTSLGFFSMSAIRYCALRVIASRDYKWPVLERIAVLGRGEYSMPVLERIRVSGQPLLCAGAIVPNDEMNSIHHPIRVLGKTGQLAELINNERLTRIIFVGDGMPARDVQECERVCHRMGIVFSRLIGRDEHPVRVEVSAVFGLRLLDLRPVHLTRRQEFVKRGFDLLCASLLLILLSPVLVWCAISIKATSRGPILYRSMRVGRGGRHFVFLKFRSMYVGADGRKRELAKLNQHHGGHIFKIRNDPRLTPIGHTLRRYSLDELPQIVNVLKGDMSIVGPRPLPADDLDPDGQSATFSIWAEQRSRVLPGITGPWQIQGRSTLPFAKMVEFDLAYIRNWSVLSDLLILLKTPWAVLVGKGAF